MVVGKVGTAVDLERAQLDGCSKLLLDVFGDAGEHARSSVGQAELPFDISGEIELIAEVRGG